VTTRAGPWAGFARYLFARWPRTANSGLSALDLLYRIALLPFRRPRRAGVATETALLVARTEIYNAAADRYFADFPNPQYLLNKPFGDAAGTGAHLVDAGILIDALGVQPGDTVLELGAGTCWLSHMLNRCGCRTKSVDVSATALRFGRAVFERDPRTNWTLCPEFIVYDGHRIPIDDGSCDSVIIDDAFHHLPNQRELLLEMHRVLRQDGIVAMCEPGRGHGSTEHSVREARDFGVLENELDVQDVSALARSCGFEAVNVIVASSLVRHEIPAGDLPAFMGGKGFARYWKTFCGALERQHYIVCYKTSVPTTRRPRRLLASIEILGSAILRLRPGESGLIDVRLTNQGDTRWLCDEHEAGWTRLGAHLYSTADTELPVTYDWHRVGLPGDVPPGGQIVISARLPVLTSPGSYVVTLDLVIEGVTWFAERCSPVANIAISVK
jgi:SAM-dependent methyltransferase